jgi:hypothetical protein
LNLLMHILINIKNTLIILSFVLLQVQISGCFSSSSENSKNPVTASVSVSKPSDNNSQIPSVIPSSTSPSFNGFNKNDREINNLSDLISDLSEDKSITPEQKSNLTKIQNISDEQLVLAISRCPKLDYNLKLQLEFVDKAAQLDLVFSDLSLDEANLAESYKAMTDILCGMYPTDE